MISGRFLADSPSQNLSVCICIHLRLICISSMAIIGPFHLWLICISTAASISPFHPWLNLRILRGEHRSFYLWLDLHFFSIPASRLPIPKARTLEMGVAAWTETGVRRSDYRQPALSLRQAPKTRLVASPGTAKE